MSRLSRLAACAVLALAFAAPAGAEEQQPAAPTPSQPAAPAVLTAPPISGPPTAAILRIDGGFSPHERWVWFDGDGTARLRGMLIDGGGRFKAHADFKRVRTMLDDAHACAPKAAVSRPMIGNDVFYYSVEVRCGTTWRVMRDWVRPAADVTDTPDMWKIVHGLEALADKLTWSPTDDDVALPNPYPMFRFASPAKTTG
jgi:hypothetical protein